MIKHKHQRYAVWLGGSFVAGSVGGLDLLLDRAPVRNVCVCVCVLQPGFEPLCHSRERYLEEGPRIARHNAVFNPV